MAVNTGDWVRSYSKGIWQVIRAVPDHFAPRFSLAEPKQPYAGPLFILKRIVNDGWKLAFEVEAAHVSLLKPLAKADRLKLERFLADNPESVRKFDAFDKPIHAILNLGFSLPRRSDFARFKSEFAQTFQQPLQAGISSDAILKAIAQSPFATNYGENPRSATLQFVCKNHEVKRKELVYRELNIQNF